ncbi:hypothetical protein Ga0466249_002219 [Sporomusaceae bacterium BoRhaA]|uniref:HD domain-containing protein n=1 Tax=Pelorhabdus rhamnosifermentans TaxID=2772457 RepID=UPI001C05FAB6|nr:HD domain-containing protein [Pelorhabdus rhamnosifermentans]MBU2701108.1 hypothetical protein [Pelorhabdus rhamnosifermentans]
MEKRFLKLLNSINRPGVGELANWLLDSDFFKAPASTKYHGSVEGGLLEHSLIVYDNLTKFSPLFLLDYSRDTFIICGLLHDICKANFYKTEMRWRKDENNQWEQYATYGIDDQFPLGHGEKSLYLIRKFIKLSDDEAMAIRWHMGAWGTENYTERQTLSAAMDKYPLILALQMADQAATYWDQK